LESNRILAAFVRDARLKRDLSQARLAKNAGVSLRQLTILEAGGNVSVAFLVKIMKALEITSVPVGDDEWLLAQPGVIDVMALIATAEAIAQHVNALRDIAVAAAVANPPRPLRDSKAVEAFAARHAGDERAPERLERAARRLATDVATVPPAPPLQAEPRERRARKSSRRR